MQLLLIHTGGTIGMVQTDDGFAPQTGVVEQVVQDMARDGSLPAQVDIARLDPLIDSAQATPLDWARLAQQIFASRDAYDGFVVTHGTDTLAYSAAALCLALSGMGKPVIVTGSMLPLSVEGNDGHRNLGDAITACTTAPPGVWVQFAGRLLHGARVRKSHSRAFDAFEAVPNAQPPVLASPTPELIAVQPQNVGVLSLTPGASSSLIALAAGHCDGLVLRCFGSGTAPDTDDIRAALSLARSREVPVLAVSQCPEGGIHFGTYAAGSVLRETGVIDGRDMSADMAFVKMQFALSQFDGFDDQVQYLATVQCGEFVQ